MNHPPGPPGILKDWETTVDLIKIHSDNSISFGSIITGYVVLQTPDGTLVEAWSNNGFSRPVDLGENVPMPKNRYALSTDAGAEEFKADFLVEYALSSEGAKCRPVFDILIEDARQRVGAWKARREGNIDDLVAETVYALDGRYPAGWGLTKFWNCFVMIEEGVSPSLAAEEA